MLRSRTELTSPPAQQRQILECSGKENSRPGASSVKEVDEGFRLMQDWLL
jgi:hypothetical protein